MSLLFEHLLDMFRHIAGLVAMSFCHGFLMFDLYR